VRTPRPTSGSAAPGVPLQGRTEGDSRRPWGGVGGLNGGRCVNDGARGYFSVRTHADPKDKRTDRIGGEVGFGGLFSPGWGMHLADLSLVQGDLIRQIGEIGASRR